MARPGLIDDPQLRIGNASRGGLVCQDLLVLESRWARFRQAWGKSWQPHDALLLSPADAVHSFGARTATGRRAGLRVHSLDSDWVVIASEFLPARRSRPCPSGCAAAILMDSDSPALQVGDRLELLRPQPRFADRANAE